LGQCHEGHEKARKRAKKSKKMQENGKKCQMLSKNAFKHINSGAGWQRLGIAKCCRRPELAVELKQGIVKMVR